MAVHSEFSVLLWSEALVLDLDQAEQFTNPVVDIAASSQIEVLLG